MNRYVAIDEWNIIEQGLHPEENRIYESIMSLGNGYMGMRGNFEEKYSGDSLKGTYIAGVYYPDKTRVGWWKNGYPEYFAKVLNAVNFIGIDVFINGVELDIAKLKIRDFSRKLDMKKGVLERSFVVIDSTGRESLIEVKRFLSIASKEIAAISYSVTPLNHSAEIIFVPYIDGDVSNEDSNYDEKFWTEVNKCSEEYKGSLTMKTNKLDFYVTAAMKYNVHQEQKNQNCLVEVISKAKFVGNKLTISSVQGSKTTLYKYIAVTNNRYHKNEELENKAYELVDAASDKGFDRLFNEHDAIWEDHWRESDIVIKGDKAAQQAIRFNIFQLDQTYTGEDFRLNIGPKGFTGEKYGGSTYWDTEAYCIPFYLSTRDEKIARNLLIYRYNQLEKAKENAQKLGVKGALYPMVTMNGEECHNEWEITFEEIHRNAAISYAIFNYIRYTGDDEYLADYGFDVLVETSRFWASRVNYNPKKDKYMILGVTGPNEYENNVSNNWYTNTMAAWSLRYTLKAAEILKTKYAEKYSRLIEKLDVTQKELDHFKEIVDRMYYPYIEEYKVFAQQDGYMDKELLEVKDIPKEELPINQHWSWDKILRSCFIKQADVLQGLYFLNDEFDIETKRRNFDFYEPRTVHESSLSPCIHSVLASELGYSDKAYELYLRTARLDLDNYNNDTSDGLHITSMAGTWMSITHGFGGLRIKNDMLSLKPFAPKAWKEYSFKIMFRNRLLKITVDTKQVIIEQEAGEELTILLFDKPYTIRSSEKIAVNI